MLKLSLMSLMRPTLDPKIRPVVISVYFFAFLSKIISISSKIDWISKIFFSNFLDFRFKILKGRE